MNWLQRLQLMFQLIAQFAPAFLMALASGRAQVRPIQVTAGSVYRISGAQDGSDDVVITVHNP